MIDCTLFAYFTWAEIRINLQIKKTYLRGLQESTCSPREMDIFVEIQDCRNENMNKVSN